MSFYLQELEVKVKRKYEKLVEDKEKIGKLIKFSVSKFPESHNLKEFDKKFDEAFFRKENDFENDDKEDEDQMNEKEYDLGVENIEKQFEVQFELNTEGERNANVNQGEREERNVNEGELNTESEKNANPIEVQETTPVTKSNLNESTYLTPGDYFEDPKVLEYVDALEFYINCSELQNKQKIIKTNISNTTKTSKKKFIDTSIPSFSLGLTQEFQETNVVQGEKETTIVEEEVHDSEDTEDDLEVQKLQRNVEKRATKPSVFLSSPYCQKFVSTENFLEDAETKVSNRIFMRNGSPR